MKPSDNKKLLEAENFAVILPVELTNGNEGRTKHFGASNKRRQEYEELFRTLGFVRTPPDYRQTVTLTRILGKRQRFYDPDSLMRGNVKEIIDALTACGWWHDDSFKWLESVEARQDGSKTQKGWAIRIDVRKVG
jgi:hypothetical protein